MTNFTDWLEAPQDDEICYQRLGNIRQKFISLNGEWHLRAIEELYFCESLNHGECILPIEIAVFDS